MSDTSSSGIFVLEGSPAGAPIAVRRETVVAFVGPAPRGPADIPIAVRSVAEYLQRFGSPDKPSRLEACLAQFFANGGTLAVVVRICRSQQRNCIRLPAASGVLPIKALCPGLYEYLRASVDYDGISADEPALFNLVIQRLDSATRPLIVEQEIYRRVSVRPEDEDYIGDVLLHSGLVQAPVDIPATRPERTVGPGVSADVAYVYSEGAALEPDTPEDYDLVGSVTEGTGLFALEHAPRIDLVCLVSAAAGQTPGPVALFAAERYCNRRHAMLLVDPPAHWQSVHNVVNDRQPRGLDSPNVLTYFPRPREGSLLGVIAGALVAEDAACENWNDVKPVLPLRTPDCLEPHLCESDISVLARVGVNAIIRNDRGQAILHSLVTLGRRAGLSREWSSLNWRRRVLFVLSAIARGSRWTLFRPEDELAHAELRRQLTSFLEGMCRAGAFAGTGRGVAWYLHGPEEHDDGFHLELGIALRRPGEFLSFRFIQTPDECTVRELGWLPELALAG